jgi:hypothetical protein
MFMATTPLTNPTIINNPITNRPLTPAILIIMKIQAAVSSILSVGDCLILLNILSCCFPSEGFVSKVSAELVSKVSEEFVNKASEKLVNKLLGDSSTDHSHSSGHNQHSHLQQSTNTNDSDHHKNKNSGIWQSLKDSAVRTCLSHDLMKHFKCHSHSDNIRDHFHSNNAARSSQQWPSGGCLMLQL